MSTTKLSAFEQDNKNFNRHTGEGMALLQNSIQKVGIIESITVSADNKIISGNARQSKISEVFGADAQPVVIETDGKTPIVIKRTDIQSGTKEFYEAAILANTVPQENIDLDIGMIEDIAIGDFDIDIESLGVDLSEFAEPQPSNNKGIAAWNNKDRPQALCDLKDNLNLHKNGSFYYTSFYQRSEQGTPIADIKKDPQMIEKFAHKALELIPAIYGKNLDNGHFCIITTPKRRNKQTHFATEICKRIAAVLQIPFYEDALIVKNKDRIRTPHTLVKNIAEPNVIVFDDIITTGATLSFTNDALHKKNATFVVGIVNHL
jgi:hypothetical protein